MRVGEPPTLGPSGIGALSSGRRREIFRLDRYGYRGGADHKRSLRVSRWSGRASRDERVTAEDQEQGQRVAERIFTECRFAPRPDEQAEYVAHYAQEAAAARLLRRSPRRRACRTCGRTYVPPRADGRYCSPACRQRAYRQRRA